MLRTCISNFIKLGLSFSLFLGSLACLAYTYAYASGDRLDRDDMQATIERQLQRANHIAKSALFIPNAEAAAR